MITLYLLEKTLGRVGAQNALFRYAVNGIMAIEFEQDPGAWNALLQTDLATAWLIAALAREMRR